MVNPSDPMQGQTPVDFVSRDGKPIPQELVIWREKQAAFLAENPPPADSNVEIVVHHGNVPQGHGKKHSR